MSLSSSFWGDTAKAPFLEVAIQHRQGALAIDVAFSLIAPWTVLFGASGSGKTTVLRAIAGLLRPDRSRIVSRSQRLADSSEKFFVPPHRRAIRLGTQAATLFPHKTVRGNVAYGAGVAAQVVEEALGCFGLRARADEPVAGLSGGERQRVSLARSVAAVAVLGEGGLLLLDEPFTGLGLVERDAMVAAVKEFLGRTKTPVLSVTHDVGEAFLLGAEVIRIGEGRVMEQGPVEVVLRVERERLLGQLGVRAG